MFGKSKIKRDQNKMTFICMACGKEYLTLRRRCNSCNGIDIYNIKQRIKKRKEKKVNNHSMK